MDNGLLRPVTQYRAMSCEERPDAWIPSKG